MIPSLFEDVPRELIDRFEQAGPAAMAFPPAVNGCRLTPSQYADVLRGVSKREDEPLALYIHIPFCPVRCLYCACHTTITHDTERMDSYLDSLEAEMDLVVQRLGSGREIYQLHVGGGTPNYLSDSQLVRLVGMVERRFKIRGDADMGIECNPRRCSAGQLELLKSLGFKRVTFGVQDLNPAVQQAIGRINSLDLVRDVYALARGIGFETIRMDLLYGLPHQTLKTFHQTLDQIVAMGPDRVCCFSYSHKPAVRPHQYAIEADGLPSPEDKLALLHEAVTCLVDGGYNWIGIDCFARQGDVLSQAQSAHRLRHNTIGYTSAPIQHLVALGMSGLGEVDGTFVQNESDLKSWSAAVNRGQLPVSWGHRMSAGDLRRREALQYLMCNLELPASLSQGLEREYARLGQCSKHGLVEVTPENIRITPRGRYFLHSLCSHHDISVAWSSNQWGVPQVV